MSCGAKQGDNSISSQTTSKPSQNVCAGGTAIGYIKSADEIAPGTVFRDGDGLPEMVVIPSGEFMMGNDESEHLQPIHRVVIRRPFALGRYTVTFDEFDLFVRQSGHNHRTKNNGLGRPRQPVVDVNWDDAQAYCQWLSGKSDKQYRLPSEAEWEYAARGGTTTMYYWGDNPDSEYAYFFTGKASEQWTGKLVVPAGIYDPNPFGLYDMLGNVWEWCEDDWHGNYHGAPTDGSAWMDRETLDRELPFWPVINTLNHLVRGGSKSIINGVSHCAYRNKHSGSGPDLGFRVARTI
jgi:formylglycine-generating enzyme required for sulfatase activity